jgi:hypothetical protein
MSFWTDLNDKIFGKDDLTQSIVAQNQAVADYVTNIQNQEITEDTGDNKLLYGGLAVTGVIAIVTVIYFARKK